MILKQQQLLSGLVIVYINDSNICHPNDNNFFHYFSIRARKREIMCMIFRMNGIKCILENRKTMTISNSNLLVCFFFSLPI